MRFPYICPGPHTLTIDVGGANGSVTKSATVTSTGGGTGAKPQILEFNGPDVASCGTSGDTVTLSYSYRTKNATAVEPEIDGQNPGAQAGYPPVHGVMRFAYVCPGPHTVTITAFGSNNQSTSQSVHVAPSSSGQRRRISAGTRRRPAQPVTYSPPIPNATAWAIPGARRRPRTRA